MSITGTATGNNYSWASNPIGFNSLVQNPTGVSPTETTVYTVTATNSSGCFATDEVAVVVITPCTSYSTTQITVCPSELPYTWNGLVFASGGTQTAILSNIANCDSLATLNLTVAALSSTTTELTICANEIPFTWNGYAFNGPGVHTANLRSVFGCDSTATLTLKVNPIPTGVLASASDININKGESINLTGFSDPISGTILNDNFNGPTNNWSSVNNGVNGNVAASNWTLRPNGYSFYNFHSNDNSQFYLSSSLEQGAGWGGLTETFLQSPVFNTVGYSSATLTFYQVYSPYENDYCRVEVSTNGGTNWSQVYQNTDSNIGSPNSFVKTTVSLNAFIGQANVIVRFKYHAVDGYHWAIDNVNISGSAFNNYSWASNPIGFTSTAQNPIGISPTVTTVYTLTATNSFGCSATDDVTIQVNGSVPNEPTVVSNFRCGPGIINLSASGCSGIYNWFTASTGGVPIGLNSVFNTPAINETTTYFVACNENNLLSNRVSVLATVNVAIVHLKETVVSGNYRASATIKSKATLSSPTNYKSGNSILLEPGFKTDRGAVFKAEIGPCQN